MFSIHNRDDLEKLKKLQETRSFFRKQIVKKTWKARLSLQYGRSV